MAIFFTSAHRKLGLVLVLLFALAVLLRLHGYSVSCFSETIRPGLNHPEILYGRAQKIRSDDWAYEGPMMWSQGRQNPAFPLINPSFGLEGQNVFVPLNIPVKHWLAFFKPPTWGFVLGNDRGMAWKWYLITLGLFYATFLTAMLVTENRFGLSLFAGLVMTYSPFFQFWSLHKAEILIHALFAFAALYWLLTCRRWFAILSAGVFCGWSAASFVIDFIYPPFQVNVGQFLIVCVPLFLLTRVRRGELAFRWPWRVAAAILGVVIVGIAGFGFSKVAGPAIALVSNTTYPGRRFAMGGDREFWTLFNNNFVATSMVASWDALGNVSEAGTFLFFSPVVVLIYLGALCERRRSFDALSLALVGYLVFTVSYAVIGFPAWLARWTLSSKMPGNRVAMGMGIADLVIVLRYLALRADLRQNLSSRTKAVVLAIWTVMLVVGAYHLFFYLGSPKTVKWIFVVLANIGLGYWLLIPRRELAFMGTLALATIAYSIGFNPVMHGGVEALDHLPLSQSLLAEEARARSLWITFAPYGAESDTMALSQLPHALGLHSLDGVHLQPDFALWHHFDSAGLYTNAYNQIGYVTFFPEPGKKTHIESKAGHVWVHSDPINPVFWDLGVTHFLVDGGDLSPYPARYFKDVATVDQRHIMKLIYPRP